MHPAVRWAGKAALTTANRPLATTRLRRLIASTAPPYRVELGASTLPHEHLIATDISWRTRYWLDATQPWPFPAGSVSHVYADNMIEHIPLERARLAFRHAYRAMAPDARLRLVTPDAERFVRMYLDGGDLLAAQTERNRRHGYRVDHPVSLLRTIFAECGHHVGYVWDYQALSDELADAGFVKIERRDVQGSEDPLLRGLEARAEPADRELYLAVEAVRP